MMTMGALFDFSHTVMGDVLQKCRHPWEALGQIGIWIREVGSRLPQEEYFYADEGVWIAKSAVISPLATLIGPCIIGRETEVRSGALVRGNVAVGDGAVVGNSTELKNAVLFDRVQVPHFNYVGDSILGLGAHLGAGAIVSNVRSDRGEIVVRQGKNELPTGRKKVGAMVGDGVEVGCNAVLCPGCVLGRNCVIYPLSLVRGTVPACHIYKSAKKIVPRGGFTENKG